MYSHKNWTPEQISKMNEEKFLIEMLDMFRFSPSNDDNSAVEQMRKQLDAVEQILQTRLETKRSN
ncbi:MULTISPECIES: hypothetical protein [Marinobacterium]|jgi:hypothetical protein|uniref:Uncharacterized protein n=1 Tax=Marinobacterium iners DSM 11526 TaxID=1122198 RepID=A0A1H4G191_9GAMM|nr:hypothetical protein [Marinobacterium iners]QSR36288.1 hypothetical protein CFI10_15085 [Marinobacterium iners]SEB02502.1 hypothetical protein SAMN02745729_11372 [Marinobacterium iners DSM 11526]